MGRPVVVGAALLSCLFIPGASEASHGQAVSEGDSGAGAGFVQKETGHTQLCSQHWPASAGDVGFQSEGGHRKHNPSSAHCSAWGFPSHS